MDKRLIQLRGYQILLKCYLYENDSKTINEQLNINEPSYVELLNGLSSILIEDPTYFLLNDKALKKAYDIIDYHKVNGMDKKRYIAGLKGLLESLKNLSTKTKKEVLDSYVIKQLDERFLDPIYTIKELKTKSDKELKNNILRLESFDYEYLKLVEDDNFMYITNNLLRQFISSTNYLLKNYPYTFDEESLTKIRNTLVSYSKDNYFAALALDNFDSYTFTFKKV